MIFSLVVQVPYSFLDSYIQVPRMVGPYIKMCLLINTAVMKVVLLGELGSRRFDIECCQRRVWYQELVVVPS